MKLPAILAFSALSLAPCAHGADLSGLWIVSSSLAQTPVTVDCSILQIGVVLSGWCEPESADAAPTALSGALNQNAASWSYDIPVQGRYVHMVYQGAVSADDARISGQLTYGTSTAGLNAVRK